MRTSRSYAIERGGPARLVLSWEGSYRAIRVSLDGVDVEVDPKKLDAVKLPDGSTVALKMRGMLGIEIRRNGEVLPGSDLDPRRVLKNAAFLGLLLAAINGASDAWRMNHGLPVTLPFLLDASLAAFAVCSFLGLRWALVPAIGAFVAHVSQQPERSTWTVIFGLVATWLLATHFFAARPRGRVPAHDA
jgi:hypothetical protein